MFRPGKYPGFKPRELVRALQISNENGWMDKALLLFQHLVDYYTAPGAAPQQIQNDAIVDEIKEEISKNNNLNFDGQLGNQIEQHWPLAASWGSTGVTAAYLKTLLGTKITVIINLLAETIFFGMRIHKAVCLKLTNVPISAEKNGTIQGTKRSI